MTHQENSSSSSNSEDTLSSRFEDPPEIPIERPKLSWQNPSPTHYQSVGMGLSLSYSLIMSPLCGMLIGWLIEQKYEINNAMVWGLSIGAILGFIMILLTLSRNRTL